MSDLAPLVQQLGERLARAEGLLERLDRRIEEVSDREHDTRNVAATASAAIQLLREDLERGLAGVRADLGRITDRLRHQDECVDSLRAAIAALDARLSRLDDRFDKLAEVLLSIATEQNKQGSRLTKVELRILGANGAITFVLLAAAEAVRRWL